MKGRCPKCDAQIEIEQAVRDQVGVDLLAEVVALGARGALVIEYVDLFRASYSAALAPVKVLRLVREIRAVIEACRFTFDGREYGISVDLIEEGLREVGNKGLIGLKSHGYLYQVLRGLIQKRRTPVTPERSRRGSSGPAIPALSAPAEDAVPVEEMKAFNRSFQDAFGRIGKPMPEGEGEHGDGI